MALDHARAGRGLDDGYRVDVQGLRGVAVLLVVLYHARLPVSGGYIGVDVFFVISGFVITRLLLRELRTDGGVDLKRFYERRVRRIMPAAAITIIATLIGSVFILSPTGPQEWAAVTGIAAALFSANFYLFYSGGGYFDPADEQNPFLHFWSLSVEEQFYLVLPGLLVVLFALGARFGAASRERTLVIGLATVALLSLALSARLRTGIGPIAEPVAQRFAFYGSPTRVWEFCAGCLVAVGITRLPTRAPVVGALLGVVGAVTVGWAALSLNDETVFPGLVALVPVLGTTALIIAGRLSNGVHIGLAIPPLVWVGDRSYSWYLWHWPAIVFAGILWDGATVALVAAALLALIPADLSYRAVENPIRRDHRIVGRRAIALGLACTLGPAAVGVAVNRGAEAGWGMDLPPGLGNDTSIARQNGCDGSESSWSRSACTFGDGDRGTILLVGDSHASAVSDSAVAAGTELGYQVAVWTEPGCPVTRADLPKDECRGYRDDLFEFIEEERPDLVMLSHRSTIYTQEEQYDMAHIWETNAAITDGEAVDLWTAEIEELFDYFETIDVPLVYLATVPEYIDFERPSLIEPLVIPSITVAELDARRDAVLSREIDLARASSAITIADVAPLFCADQSCSPELEGTLMYYDANHLNPSAVPAVQPILAAAFETAARQ